MRYRHILRRLLRTPAFSTVAVLTLALGIGANSAIFSVIEGVLLKPLPFARPQELIGVWHTAKLVNLPELNMSPFLYFTYRDQNRTLQDIGMWDTESSTVTGLAEPERVDTLQVTDGVLPLLGVPPEIGRWFSRQDDSPGSPETAMLMYGYWQLRFGGDRSVIGRRLMLDGVAHEIIGVMPEAFISSISSRRSSSPCRSTGPRRSWEASATRARPPEARRHHCPSQRRCLAYDSHRHAGLPTLPRVQPQTVRRCPHRP